MVYKAVPDRNFLYWASRCRTPLDFHCPRLSPQPDGSRER